jgi:hypothetical protein
MPVSAVDEMVPGLVPGVLTTAPTSTALAEAIRHLTGFGRPGPVDFEKAWHARSVAFDPARISRQWVEAVRR